MRTFREMGYKVTQCARSNYVDTSVTTTSFQTLCKDFLEGQLKLQSNAHGFKETY